MKEGYAIVTRYEEADQFGNMGCVLGVTTLPSGKYRPVINTYHSGHLSFQNLNDNHDDT